MIRHLENEELKNHIEKKIKGANVNNRRFRQKEIVDYLHNEIDACNNKIYGIYGLRRTGKSIMMYQAIQDIGYKDCLFINCKNDDSYIELEKFIENTEKKYIFIDEITKVPDFVKLSSSLSDIYTDNKKIVITGTDSAALLFAADGELYDRMIMQHTTYVSFAEFNYLLGKTLEEYVQYGGVLTDGKKIYNDDGLEEYTNTAILRNIYHGVKNTGEDSGRLYTLYLSGALENAVDKTIEIRAKEFVLNVIRGEFTKSHDLGSARELMLKKGNRTEIEKYAPEDVSVIDHINKSDIFHYIAKTLDMKEIKDFEEKDIRLITNLLKKLDVLYEMSDGEILFTQPGMQYALTEILLDNVIYSNEYTKLHPNTQKMIKDKIIQDSIGHILENIIRTDIIKCPELSKMEIGKMDDEGNGEFDLYIINPETHNAIVYEIKRSFIQTDNQLRHLRNHELCEQFQKIHKCKIIQKTVIYQGKNDVTADGIQYYNAEEYLLHLKDAFKNLSIDNEKNSILDNNNNKSHEFSSESKNSENLNDTKACLDEPDIDTEKDSGDERDDI